MHPSTIRLVDPPILAETKSGGSSHRPLLQQALFASLPSRWRTPNLSVRNHGVRDRKDMCDREV